MLLSSICSLSRYFPSLSVLAAGHLCPSIPIQDTCQTRSSQHICGRALQLPTVVPRFYDPPLSIVAATFRPSFPLLLSAPPAHVRPHPKPHSSQPLRDPALYLPTTCAPRLTLSHQSCWAVGQRRPSRGRSSAASTYFDCEVGLGFPRVGRHPRRLGCRVRVFRFVRSTSRVIV
jgi:hypothetical protein